MNKKVFFYASVLTIVTLSGIAIFLNSLNLFNSSNNLDGNSTNENTIGFKISQKMFAKEDNISFIWCLNNSWVNDNLTNIYGFNVEGIISGINDNSMTMTLIHNPPSIVQVTHLNIGNIMKSLRTEIEKLNNTIDNSSIDFQRDIIPPPTYFSIDIAYEDNTTLSIFYAETYQILGIINGTWDPSDYWGEFYGGTKIYTIYYNYSECILLSMPKDYISYAIEYLEQFVLGKIPA